jgi:glycosyltransferase involved in cell wall biosynthesis
MAVMVAFNKWILKKELKNLSPDAIFHPTLAYRFPDPMFIPVKNPVFTIHDMIIEKQNPDADPHKRLFAHYAKKIIAVSETTKQDIIRLWELDPDKIEVIYHASSLNLQIIQKPAEPLPGDYLLYVGDRGGHKNFSRFIQGVAGLLSKYRELYLVCAGKREFSHEEKNLLKELGIEKKILFFLRPGDSELAYLYTKALLFVFPSLDEGFGIPVLEAWACGTPVVLSRNNCFVEVAAEAGLYFDPLSPESIGETVEKILLEKRLQKILIRRGHSRIREFSWEKTLYRTCKLYKSLL